MIVVKYVLLIFIIIASQCLAQEHKDSAAFNFEDNKKDTQTNIQESNEFVTDIISVSVFVRVPGVIIYNLNRKEFFITPCLGGGFAMSYNKVYFEIGTFVNKNNTYGFSPVLSYTLWANNLDENWKSLIALIGEVVYIPVQQSNPDSWIYTTGLAYMIYHLFKWGTPAIALVLGGAYGSNEFSLTSLMMLNLAIPIF
jgi:hypothetical protein